jgi:LPS export ABC transporter protein LptC
MRSMGFALALLAAAYTGWFWLSGRELSTVSDSAAATETPRMILTGITQLTTDASGAWLSTLKASRILSFTDPDITQLHHPDWLSQQGLGTRHIQAQRATLRDEHHWTLEHDVLVLDQPPNDPPLRIRTDFLEYDTLLQQATTPLAVAIDQAERMSTDAIGMDIDFSTEEFFLHDQVRTRYWP